MQTATSVDDTASSPQGCMSLQMASGAAALPSVPCTCGRPHDASLSRPAQKDGSLTELDGIFSFPIKPSPVAWRRSNNAYPISRCRRCPADVRDIKDSVNAGAADFWPEDAPLQPPKKGTDYRDVLPPTFDEVVAVYECAALEPAYHPTSPRAGVLKSKPLHGAPCRW